MRDRRGRRCRNTLDLIVNVYTRKFRDTFRQETGRITRRSSLDVLAEWSSDAETRYLARISQEGGRGSSHWTYVAGKSAHPQ